MNFIIQKLKSKHISIKKYTNRAKLIHFSLILREREEEKTKYIAPLVENYYDLDLSVEFLSQLFKYVDELCEYINNGDQNGNRSSVVIQNLNYAVSCYRVNLPNPDEVIKGQLISEANFKNFN